jgi:hypothetical protein
LLSILHYFIAKCTRAIWRHHSINKHTLAIWQPLIA